MKKLFLLILPFLSAMLHAEELRFVTVLSSPVGTFNRLEEVDPTVPVKSPVINFCTTLGNSGTVKLQGNKNPEVNTLKMSNAAKLGGNGKDYVLNELTMRHGGTLKGSRLLANVVKVPTDGSMGVSENLYSNSLTVAGAKTGKLYVNGTDAVIENAGPAGADMVWSNEYQTDKACDNAAGCAKQYLLKEKGTIVIPELDCTDSTYRSTHKSECCPLVADPESSLGADYCYLRKYVWGPRESKTMGSSSSTSFTYYTPGPGCTVGISSAVCPGYNEADKYRFTAKCPDDVAEGVECGASNDGKTCHVAINGHWWETPGVVLSGSHGSNNPSDQCSYSGANAIYCTCLPTAWPGHTCQETFVKNGW